MRANDGVLMMGGLDFIFDEQADAPRVSVHPAALDLDKFLDALLKFANLRQCGPRK